SYLRKQLLNRDIPIEDSLMDPNALDKKFKIRPASIIKNSYNKLHNYLLVDKGNKDSVVQDMGVITSKGIVGIIENTSSNYANVQSVLNTFSEINAAIKNTNNFGSLKWNGEDFNVVQLVDVLRSAPIKKGDTIITGGMSSIFPK